MPYHMLLDHAGEAKLGKLQFGTTRRGIGPCYAEQGRAAGRFRIPPHARREDPQEEDHRRGSTQSGSPLRAGYAKDPRLDLADDD